MKPLLELFAVTAPGLEHVCAAELQTLKMESLQVVPGGVIFAGGLHELYTANLWLRSASRILVRVGSVKARDFPELFRRCQGLPWGRFVRPGTGIKVRAVSHRSRLSHTGRVADTVVESVIKALGAAHAVASGQEQIIYARFEEDHCQLSIDSSGELLHRRGYREETGPAPLRETLAAGILQMLGWSGGLPLADPMCGSGTFLIEAALQARQLAPGRHRDFAFQSWPGFRPGLWAVLLAEADRAQAEPTVALFGSDRDPATIALARRNAQRAGVGADLSLEVDALAGLVPRTAPGLVLCNPPYGARLGSDEDLRKTYQAFGRDWRRAFPGWRLAFLCPHDRLARDTGLSLEKIAILDNGGIPVTLFATAR